MTSGSECAHPRFMKDRVLGADTGDKICTTCREEFTRAEHAEIMRRRSAE